MYRHFSVLLLFCLIYQSGNPSKPVTGTKGGNVTLTCELEASKIVQIEIFGESGEIDICLTEECSGQVFKTAACDVVIKNLSFSDAGKYTLRVFYSNDQTNTQEQTYQLHIHDDVTVKRGKPLKMHVLLSNAHKVERNSSEVWVKVWERGHGVWSNRMNDSDGNLIINEFMDTDRGSYRVLDAEGDVLITVTVTESSTGSTDKLDTDDDNTGHKLWIVLGVCLGILVMIVIAFIIKQRRRRGNRQAQEQNNPVHLVKLENLQ